MKIDEDLGRVVLGVLGGEREPRGRERVARERESEESERVAMVK